MNHIGIVGAGVMGRGIAQTCASKGKTIILFDINKKALDEAFEEITMRFAKEVQKKRMTQDEMEESLARISRTQNLGDVAKSSEVVIEAAPEDPTIKKTIFKKISEYNQECILASNTSSISIDLLAEDIPNQSRVIGMHWFNPPPIMKLIEIVVGESTATQTLTAIKELAVELGKEPIVVKNTPGFATSRLGVALGLEAIRMVEQGVASPEDIDKAMELGYRHPMGPLKLTDYIGLDTRLRIAEYLASQNISPAFEVPALLRKMVADGKLGRKSGEGFYKWGKS
ncbi:MAG: 3-hydroxyacyl-CoA dehydrogenase family protein [Gammaproteobacteria bacterium]|nr:MAG: 3-hydroxyacyl-CoA dehydrogenase family protein [Gammaproteobacteria bacterium]